MAYRAIERLCGKWKVDAEPRLGLRLIMRESLSLAGVLLCACVITARAAEPGPSKNPLLNGLVQLPDARAKLAFARPGTDWSKYRTVEIRPLRIPDTVRNAAPGGARPSFGESYVLGDKEVAKLQQAYAAAMQDQLPRAGFGLVSTAGSNTLIVASQIVSIRLRAPIESTRRSFSSRGRIYSQGGGSMVMAAVLADGETGRVLAVAADRSYPSNVWGINNRATNLAEAKRAFNRWASALRDRLAGLRRPAVAASLVGPKSN